MIYRCRSACRLMMPILAALLGVWGAARVGARLVRERDRLAPAGGAALADAPPAMAFVTVALGGFRGLIADLLWLRALHLQEGGRFFELAQLADWIAKLQPQFTAVWSFQAWNMAYNISVLFPDPDHRWRWVNNGIRLLRDEGLRFNPRQPALYRDLGWLYQHKIGFLMDSAHAVYKRRLATEMQAALGGGRPPPAGAPASAVVAGLGLGLDPAVMARVDAVYGPLDWRLPDTLALYWAWRGRQLSLDGLAPPDRGCDQMIYQCLVSLFRRGRLAFDPATDRYLTTPNLALLPGVQKAFEEMLARHPEALFRDVHASFLGEAVVLLAGYGETDAARALYADLAGRYGAGQAVPPFEAFVETSLAWMARPESDVTPDHAVAVVEGLFVQAVRSAAAGAADRAAASERRAREFWDGYMQARQGDDHRQRTGLPPIDELRRAAQERCRANAAPACILPPP